MSNRRMSKCGFALLSLFYKIDRIHSFDIRPARNALKLVRGKFNNFIHNSKFTLTQRSVHGRRVFIIRYSAVRCSIKLGHRNGNFDPNWVIDLRSLIRFQVKKLKRCNLTSVLVFLTLHAIHLILEGKNPILSRTKGFIEYVRRLLQTPWCQ